MNKFLLFSFICLFAFNSCKKENNPITPGGPPIPSLASPLNNSTNIIVSPVLIWNSSSGATTYSLMVASDMAFANIITNQSKISDTSYQISALNNTTSFYWKVCAKDNNGSSDWSSVWKFTTGLAPSSPTLTFPEKNSTPVFIPITFSWNPVADATSYKLQVSTENSFTNIQYNQDSLTTTNQQITILKPLTQYFWRVRANSIYGSSGWSTPAWNFFTAASGKTGTPCPGIETVLYSNRTYNTVQIGNQCWLKENLDAGTMIPGNNSQTNNNIIEKFCYNNDTTNCKIFGGLYQWDEAMQYGTSGSNVQGICPAGWHIPDTTEFSALTTTLNNNGSSLKALSQGSGAGAGTDASGFSGLLAGYKGAAAGAFGDLGYYTNFWSSMQFDATKADLMWIGYTETGINQNHTDKVVGFSVRCIKN
jgi:uncharacterized protein (TIGR02145 family)